MADLRRPVHAALVAVALAASACAVDESPQAASDAVACSDVEHPPDQAGGHLLGDQDPPEPYSSTPPTSGWHTTGAFDITVHHADDPLPEPGQVSVLEAGAVVVTHHDLAEADLDALTTHVGAHHEGQVAVTPYTELEPGEVTFTAWGTLQRCDGVDLDALDEFVDEHGAPDPARPGEH